MEFKLAEKLAFIKAIDKVIMADGKVQPSEVTIINKLAGIMRFDMGMLPKARQMDAGECKSVLKTMPPEKKHALNIMLTEAANADGRVDENELRLITEILETAGVKTGDNPSSHP